MSEQEEESPAESEAKKPSALKGLLGGLAGAVGLAAVAAGVVFFIPSETQQCGGVADAEEKKTKSYEDIAFVNLKPLVITLGPDAKSEYLKVSVSVETTKDNIKTAEHLEPRFRDVLNSYLRAVDEEDLIEPAAMTRLRAQILRRLQVVASPEVVSDVLITDFVLN